MMLKTDEDFRRYAEQERWAAEREREREERVQAIQCRLEELAEEWLSLNCVSADDRRENQPRREEVCTEIQILELMLAAAKE